MPCRPVVVSVLAVVGVGAVLFSPASAEGKKKIVAVFDIENRGAHLRRAALRILSDYLADRLAATGAYKVVPRDQLKKRLVAQRKRSYKKCFAQSCQIEIGKDLAAQKSLATKVMKIADTCVLTSTLFDLRTSTTDRGATARGKCDGKGVMASIDQVVAKLAAGVVQSGGPGPSISGPSVSGGTITRATSRLIIDGQLQGQ